VRQAAGGGKLTPGGQPIQQKALSNTQYICKSDIVF